MTWFPRSLAGRTMMLAIIAIVACESLTMVVFSNYRHTFLSGKGREYMASHVMLVRAALRHTSPDQVAADLLLSPGRRLRLVAQPPAGASANPPSPEPYSDAMIRGMREDYGVDAVRFTEPPDASVYVQVAPGGWWLMTPYSRFEVPIPWPIIFAVLGAVGLMAIIVAFYVVHLSRPLKALSEAAETFDIGQRIQLALSGPQEVRAVTAQFNAMSERLSQNDAERRVMLAGLPHDLRAPLARAKLRLALMNETDQNGFTRDLSEIERIADQFVSYLRGLDRDQSRFAPTDVAQIIRDRVRVWQGAGQDVDSEQVDPMMVSGDQGALERAVDNLIANAFAHGAAPVRLRGLGGAAQYRIEVEDHGPGIPESLRQEALRPFVRLDAARGVRERGASGEGGIPSGGHCGLGLAVVQAVSKLHGGRVDLHNSEAGGLIAAIELPLAA